MRSKKFRENTILYIILIMVAVLFIAPPICLFVSSFKTSSQISVDMSNVYAFLPHGKMSMDNYIYLFGKLSVGRFFINSLISSSVSILLAVLFNAMMGYALGMLKFKGKGILLSLILSLLIVPSEAVIVNKMIVVNSMGLIDKMLSLILPFMATPFYIFLFYQHFKDMPYDLMEAAVMDGCSYPQIFFKIMFPLSKPVIATVSILLFVKRWGDVAWPAMVTRSNAIKVLPLALQSFYGDMNDWGPIFAMGTVMTVPVMIIFVAFQKQFIQSIAMSGIKG
ncbi:ABC transporter permease subunit [Clostridium sp. MCC353]|uniref:carbohydrate ABC transporter permease n=1 Tax=Clostridium sp. MCC353 TaxID=2592646 RepID=UPI001C016E85|nr:carbohydrate ABC transporter permease [Clostridium sp. MCC353]MBT9777997.1 ABC transporter permease subunit [Clostridium sp. MCC353]